MRPIRLLTGIAGGPYAGEAGTVVSVPLSLAAEWVRAGLAEDVAAAETASVQAPERAMRPRARARGAA